MKNFFIVITLCCISLSFSQEKKVVKFGYITFNSNTTLEFKNLTIDTENASYFNEVSQTLMTFPLNSIKKIIDENGTAIYQTAKVVKLDTNQQMTKISNDTVKKPTTISIVPVEKLRYQSASKIYLNDQKLSSEEISALLKRNSNIVSLYEKGKKESKLGDILLGGGLGMFIGGGLANLSAADSGKSGSPLFLIVGLATSAVGLPVKLGGTKKIKTAINQYNQILDKKVTYFQKPELKLITNTNGLGFQLRF